MGAKPAMPDRQVVAIVGDGDSVMSLPEPGTAAMNSIPVVVMVQIAHKIVAAQALAGADEFYCIGGVQAIAAMAYGSDTIRPVDMLAVPGDA